MHSSLSSAALFFFSRSVGDLLLCLDHCPVHGQSFSCGTDRLTLVYRGVHGPLRDCEVPEMLVLCFMDLQKRHYKRGSISNRAVMNFNL